MVCDTPESVIGVTDYGGPFASVVRTNNIFGTQFHPEKSHRFGMTLLRNFIERI
jgi:glutamine amidotransferase